ncbi:MAG: hypothetical protein AAF939_05970 [Planctomycetota bacterium]
MNLLFKIFTVVVLCLSAVGCSMCCGPYDYDYPTFGGKHERVNANWGRVGSIFSDPLASISGPSADSNLKDPPEAGKSRSFDFNDDNDELDRLREKLQKELNDGPGDGSQGPIEDDTTMMSESYPNTAAGSPIPNRLRKSSYR